MNDLRTLQSNPFNTPFDDQTDNAAHNSRHQQQPQHIAEAASSREREEWEDWDSECDEEASDDHDKPLDDSRRGEYPPLLATIEEAPDTPADSRNPASFSSSVASATTRRSRTSTTMSTVSILPAHHAGPKPSRLKSRARQKAQNAKAGIRLVTDMTKLRKQQQLQQQLQQQQIQQQQQLQQQQVQQKPTGKFVDNAALLALEGKPSDSSIGNWNWRRRRANSTKSTKTISPGGERAQDLSPNDRPIVIGISLPEDDLVGRTVSPQTATLETPINIPMYLGKGTTAPASQLQQVTTLSPQAPMQSVWSPDTEEGGSPRSAGVSNVRAASSIYSQFTGQSATSTQTAPPVPSLPSAYKDALGVGVVPTNTPNYDHAARRDSLLLREAEYYDADTPITLFEEDNSPASYNRMSRPRGRHARSMADTIDTTHSGWWDHVQTPFAEQSAHPFSAKTSSPLTPSSAKTPLSAASIHAREAVPAVPALPPTNTIQSAQKAAVSTTPISPLITPEEEWWKKSAANEKKRVSTHKPELGISTAIANAHTYQIHERSPTVASSSRSAAPAVAQRIVTPRLTPRIVHISEKAGAAPMTGRSVLSDRNDDPPPYEPSSQPEMSVRYRAVFPPSHPLRVEFPPSPGPVSPSLAHTMTSQGGIHMSDVPLTPAGVRSAAAAAGTPLPARPSGALLPGTTVIASDAAAKVERSRRRHEKEDAAAMRAGGMWRGRGCLPNSGCFGRKGGRESRRRHRLICMGVIGALVLLVTVITALAVTLSKKHAAPQEKASIWLNTTGFPPIPTGVLTVIGTDNAVNKASCVSPSSIWSCSLPKEQQASNGQFDGDAPSFFIDIQFDNSTKKLWDVPAGAIPTPVSSAKATTATTTSTQQFDAGFTPNPAPPSFQELWFLGNTTDNIKANNKAGEPTPFYITFMSSMNDTTPGPNAVVDKRAATPTASDGFPEPSLNADGTGAPAVMHPLPMQQPLRLYDRGLPTEHFGFYTYFSKTIYLQSITPNTSPLPSDGNGGSLEVDANHIVTWLQTRFLVKIWTRMENQTQLLGTRSTSGASGSNSTQPGSFPYPITLTEDLHGGDFSQKGVFARDVDGLQRIQTTNASIIIDNLEFGGTLINHSANPTFGGSDGGTGGCQCTWNNFLGTNGNVIV